MCIHNSQINNSLSLSIGLNSADSSVNAVKNKETDITPQGITHVERLDGDINAAIYDMDEFAVDLLFHLANHNLSFSSEDDNLAKLREKSIQALFDLYTGKAECKTKSLSEVRATLSEKSAFLYSQLEVINKECQEKKEEPFLKMHPKCLIMAGFAAKESDEKKGYINLLKEEDNIANLIYDLKSENTLFCHNRYVIDIEIDVFSRQINSSKENKNFYLHKCAPIHSRTSENLRGNLFDYIGVSAENIRKIRADKKLDKKNQMIPLCIGDHYIMLGLFTSATGIRSSFIFDSLGKYDVYDKFDEWVKKDIRQLIAAYGAENEPLIFKTPIQDTEDTPNACGVFVAKAMQKLACSPDTDHPDATLERFIEEFAAQESAKKAIFNLAGRAELLAAVVDIPDIIGVIQDFSVPSDGTPAEITADVQVTDFPDTRDSHILLNLQQSVKNKTAEYLASERQSRSG